MMASQLGTGGLQERLSRGDTGSLRGRPAPAPLTLERPRGGAKRGTFVEGTSVSFAAGPLCPHPAAAPNTPRLLCCTAVPGRRHRTIRPTLRMGKLRQKKSVMGPGSGQAAQRPRQHSGLWHLVLDIVVPNWQLRTLRPQGQSPAQGHTAGRWLRGATPKAWALSLPLDGGGGRPKVAVRKGVAPRSLLRDM